MPAFPSSAFPVLRLSHPERPRAAHGHPWAFGNELREPPPTDLDGNAAELRDARGRFLGVGIVNSRSQIAWRRYSRDRTPFDAAFLKSALTRAIGRRETGSARRLVWSESDDLPGLVVDQFESLLSVQVSTLAMERVSGLVGDILQDLLAPEDIVWRNDAPIRRLEGLPLEVRTRSGQRREPRWMRIGELEQRLDLEGGQKTGLYLDQRHEHAALAAHTAGRRVLDCFCHQGAFGLHAARAGASHVLGIDQSPSALESAGLTAARNGLDGSRVEFAEANVFDFLPALEPGRTWDVIVLDPPPFARSQRALDGAIRGYKELHLRALQHLNPGGLLATYTCSHHISGDAFLTLIGDASHDARRRVRVLSHRHQPADHPVLPGFPESEYLRGFFLLAE